jgi:hypothetical protein
MELERQEAPFKTQWLQIRSCLSIKVKMKSKKVASSPLQKQKTAGSSDSPLHSLPIPFLWARSFTKPNLFLSEAKSIFHLG